MNKNRPVFEVHPVSLRSEVYLDSFIEDIAHARQQVKDGKILSWKEVKEHLGLKS